MNMKYSFKKKIVNFETVSADCWKCLSSAIENHADESWKERPKLYRWAERPQNGP